jgi:hypothetical protein
MHANGAGKDRSKRRDDPTMRWIERKQLFAAIALQCGISPASVRAWKRVPPLRVIDVERATGRPRHLIRPDLHPTH